MGFIRLLGTKILYFKLSLVQVFAYRLERLGKRCGLFDRLVTACIFAAEISLFLRPGDYQAGLFVDLDVTYAIEDAAHHLDVGWPDLL